MTKTVLIVEDSELNMKLFHDLLEAHGIATIETRSGLQAVDMARANHPDLILMDIQLPDIHGLEVIKRLKADEGLKHIPVIAVTAFTMKGDEEKIREGGCDDYISKPIFVTPFMDTVRTYLDKPRPPIPLVQPSEQTPAEPPPKFQIIDRDEQDDERDDFPFDPDPDTHDDKTQDQDKKAQQSPMAGAQEEI